MAEFEYKGRTARGDLVTGRIESDSAEAVANQLFNTGITPIDITERAAGGEAGGLWQRLQETRRPSLDDLILFSRQMYTLTKSGVPLIRGLNSLAESTRNPALRGTLRDVVEALQGGRELAAALARHPQVFSPLYLNIIRVGESAGRLEEGFLRLYEYLQREKEIRNRIRQALRYPTIVVSFIAVAIAIVTLYVIPAFKGIFDRFGQELPLPTRIILAVSDFMVEWWWLILGGLVAALIAFFAWIRTEEGRYRWDKFKIHMPIVGGIVLRASLARYARAFTMTIRSGVPLTQALTLIARGVNNEYLGERIAGMRTGVERGESLYRTTVAAGLFTPLVAQMIAVGEETGKLDDMLEEVADFYEREVDYDLRTLSERIEPIMIIIIAVMVLILALGVFLPMWDLYKVVG